MGQAEYNACIAAGGSPATCAAYLEEEGGTVADAVGFKLYRPDGSFAGRLTQEPERGLVLRNEYGWARFRGGTYTLESGESVSLNAAGDIILKRTPSAPSPGRAPPAYSGTPAGIEHQARLAAEAAAAQRKWEEDEAERRRIWEEGEAEKARLLKERLQKMDIARSLAETRTGARLRGIEHRTETAGRDPFKLTALLAGEAAPTGTPMDVHKGKLASFINAPVPIPAELESIEQLDAAIAQLGKLQQPPQPGVMGGFAKGGTATPGDTGVSIRVGEEGPETLILRPNGDFEVVPEIASAAGGFKAEDFGGFRGLFGAMRESAGLPRTLFSLTSPYGGQRFPMSTGDVPQPAPFMTPDIWAQDVRSKLGVVDPAKRTGLGAQPAAWQPFGSTSAITQGLRETGMTDPGQLHQLAGLAVGLLPAPFKIGNFFSWLDEAQQGIILKAYELAGIPEATFRNLAMSPMIRGQERGLTTIG